MPKPILTKCQKEGLAAFNKTHDNLFVTGCAGSGKSFLLKQMLAERDPERFPIVASTGAAAVLVGGRTFHSFFGLGIMEGGMHATIERALGNKRVTKRMKAIDGFVLDEVSMIPADALQAAESICRRARKSDRPWGGARVIAVGDFFQLPPIARGRDEKPWCFTSSTWRISQFTPIVLETIVRSQDEEFLHVLNSIRHGEVTQEVADYLDAHTQTDDIDPNDPHLFPHRATTERFNQQRLSAIDDKLVTIATEYEGDDRGVAQLQKNAPVPEKLHLKTSALVMMRVNDHKQRYVNGSLATVLDISKDSVLVELQSGERIDVEKHIFAWLDAQGEPTAIARNFPLTLAYGTTIHKSQGATFDRIVVDLKKLWEPGQAYVALSRLRSGTGLTLSDWNPASIRTDPAVVDFYDSL